MANFLDLLLSPFSFTFMQQAFLIVLLVAIPTALLSCFLVLKGWSLMGDAISHSVLPGIVIAYVLAIPFTLGAFVAGMFCALATGYLKENSRIKEDTIMGVVFSSMFAFGIVLMTKVQSNIHLDHILFGDPLGVSWRDISEATVITLAVILFSIFKGKDLLVFIFDHQHAQAIGLPTKVLHYSLLALLSLTIVAALKAVGMILVISMLIAPGATAFMLTRRFQTMVVLALFISVANAFLGMYLSFFIDSAPGPTIILLLTANFIGVFTYTTIKNRYVEQQNIKTHLIDDDEHPITPLNNPT
ncbi:metal ABC transporter permease [Photobacterium kishitanii]|uniref:Metal ABC transporter permease n=1 Tax=Photobacterium kishitanii TaxID=318456 RepID=A0AAX0Z1P5_9GAMM|nr:metal ABC transporter permease [Photobacterium kishitanii]PSW61062.1 metal ABC transporter permease [Photobacterium kishitanii]PSX20392.1 metal ABC transporter permease [Photobacterium kishitanii]PSX29153.1 metal ABC transporter permease [Photobacterium kishitanii]PSX31884.1 metal ABC transporter permease [Photobacterium kishitanii]PSX46179.1 metal ABC transporter permease [Photobacterium kishitanii]